MIRKKAYILNVFLALVWAAYLLLAKYAISELPLSVVGFFARSSAMIGLLVFILSFRSIRHLWQPKKDLFFLLLIGVLAFLLDFAGYVGLKYSTTVNGSILLRTDIIFIITVGYFLLGERFYKSDWLCIAGMVIGALMVMNISLESFELHIFGDLMFLLSAALIVCNAFIIKIKLKDVNPAMIAFYNSLGATVCYFLFIVLSGNLARTPLAFQNVSLPVVLLGMGILNILLYLSYYYCLKELPVWIVRTLMLTMPIFNLILGWLFLGESMGLVQFLGMAVIMSAAFGIILRHRDIRSESVNQKNQEEAELVEDDKLKEVCSNRCNALIIPLLDD